MQQIQKKRGKYGFQGACYSLDLSVPQGSHVRACFPAWSRREPRDLEEVGSSGSSQEIGGVPLEERWTLNSSSFSLFAIEVKLCLAKFSYHGALHHLALKKVVLPSHGPESPELSHSILFLSVSWLSQVFATVTEGWLNTSLYKKKLWVLLRDGHSYWKSY